MTIYRKCRLCTRKVDCQIKADMGRAMAGLGITSVLHRCAEYEPPFKCGDPVLVTTRCSLLVRHECRDRDFPLFPG